MIINDANIELTYRGFKSVVNTAFEKAESYKDTIAMTVQSGTGTEDYGWLGQFPQLREWIGERIIKELSNHGFKIENKKFESTVKVKREHIEDDKLGVYKPMFSEMGRTSAMHPNELIMTLLKQGHETMCYDGQNFFDPDHPLLRDGQEISISNYDQGPEETWYLIDGSKEIKPIIWQERQAYDFQALNGAKDYNVFMRDEYLFGVRARVNCGFGLWQMAHASELELNEDNYFAARASMMEMRGDQDQILGITPTHLVVPPSLEQKARKLLKSTMNENSSNVWQDSAEIIVSPYLA